MPIAAPKWAAASVAPKNSRSDHLGTPNRKRDPKCGATAASAARASGSSASKKAATSNTTDASCAVSANIDTQSSDRQAGTIPRVLNRPRVGFSPTRLLKAAGMRPDPAVSVPREKLTSPVATATADPELDPPGMKRALKGLRGTP